MTPPPTLEDAALAWAVRVADPAFTDWSGLIAWLDGDGARNEAYNRASAIVADATAETTVAGPSAVVLPFVPRAASPAPPRSRRWVAAGGGFAVAASIAGAFLLTRPAERAAAPRIIEAPAGPVREFALADGSRIALAGRSRLVLDPANPREIRLDRGRAVFTVRHDAAAPFHVAAGAHRIVDVGTTFEVAQEGPSTEVAVAEGEVIVDPAATSLRLNAGDTATLRGDGSAQVGRVAPDAIAQWRHPRMSYRDAPLTRVAADLSAALGHPVTVHPSLAGRRFTGALVPATLRDRPDDLAALLDLRVHVEGGEWELRNR